MKKAVIVCLPADADRVRPIVAAQSQTSTYTRWRKGDPADDRNWTETCDETRDAGCVVFCWSGALADAEPVARERYRALVEEVAARNAAIAVALDGRAPPEHFERITTYELPSHRVTGLDEAVSDIVTAVQDKIADLDPSPPRSRLGRRVKLVAAAGLSAVSALALFIGLYRDAGLDKVISAREAAAWRDVRPGSCDDLRGFIARFPDGVRAAEAQALLTGRSTTQRTGWETRQRELPLFVGGGTSTPARTEGGAQHAAKQRAAAESASRCRQLAAAGGAKHLEASFRADAVTCQAVGGGQVCSVDGMAICRLQEPRDQPVERCGAR